jgi:hypothetical protein
VIRFGVAGVLAVSGLAKAVIPSVLGYEKHLDLAYQQLLDF